ncbi:MAG: hypothetical protein WBA45_12935 [Microthrixaceae bacterium]
MVCSPEGSERPHPPFTFAEEVGLSSYSPAAEAHMIRVEVLDSHHVDVIVGFVSSQPMRSHCELTPAVDL